jgi:hypothetical protein
MLKKTETLVKTSTNFKSAVENKSAWLGKFHKATVAGVSLGKDGPNSVFLLESERPHTQLTALQQAVKVLTESKGLIVKMQWRLMELYDERNFVNLYMDTGKSQSLREEKGRTLTLTSFQIPSPWASGTRGWRTTSAPT